MIKACDCGRVFTVDTIERGKIKVYRDKNGNAVTKCECGKELK